MSELKAYIAPTPDEKGLADYYLKSEVDEVIARHKYKRCLAMAEWCKARYDEEDAKVNGCGASWEYISKEMKYWERWGKRWLKLAEKFKPNSTAQ